MLDGEFHHILQWKAGLRRAPINHPKRSNKTTLHYTQKSPVSASTGTDTIKFAKGSNEATRFKFPSVPVTGNANLKLHSDGTYDNIGGLRNDGTQGSSYNVAFWWRVKDAKGKKYYFGSQKCALNNAGADCQWRQEFQRYQDDKIEKHWVDLQAGAKATAYPVLL